MEEIKLYNGHAKKGEEFRNNMTNFGILMEIPGIGDPFEWSRKLVSNVNSGGTGFYYSPSRRPSETSEGETVSANSISHRDLENIVKPAFRGHFQYIEDFIENTEIEIKLKHNDKTGIPSESIQELNV